MALYTTYCFTVAFPEYKALQTQNSTAASKNSRNAIFGPGRSFFLMTYHLMLTRLIYCTPLFTSKMKTENSTQITNIFIVYIFNRERFAQVVQDSVMDSKPEAPSENTSASRRKRRVLPHAGPKEPPERDTEES